MLARFVVAALVALAALPAAAQPVTVRVDWLFRSYHAPFFLGVEKGWYREVGLEPAIREGRGSGNVVQLVGNKSDTFGFASAEGVVRGVQAGIPVVSVATIMPRNADVLYVLAGSSIKTAADLKGKRIGSTPGGTSDSLLPAFLRGAGLAPSDVTIVPIDAQLKAQMLLQGRVDAANSPVWTKSLFRTAAGDALMLPYADHGVEVIGYGIVVNTEVAQAQPDLVAKFVAATLRSWAYAVDHPDEALAALAKHAPDALKPSQDAVRQDLVEALRLVRPAVPGKPFGTQSPEAWERMQKQLVEFGVAKQSKPVDQYLTNRFLR